MPSLWVDIQSLLVDIHSYLISNQFDWHWILNVFVGTSNKLLFLKKGLYVMKRTINGSSLCKHGKQRPISMIKDIKRKHRFPILHKTSILYSKLQLSTWNKSLWAWLWLYQGLNSCTQIMFNVCKGQKWVVEDESRLIKYQETALCSTIQTPHVTFNSSPFN